jgi:hypothetical protein
MGTLKLYGKIYLLFNEIVVGGMIVHRMSEMAVRCDEFLWLVTKTGSYCRLNNYVKRAVTLQPS